MSELYNHTLTIKTSTITIKDKATVDYKNYNYKAKNIPIHLISANSNQQINNYLKIYQKTMILYYGHPS